MPNLSNMPNVPGILKLAHSHDPREIAHTVDSAVMPNSMDYVRHHCVIDCVHDFKFNLKFERSRQFSRCASFKILGMFDMFDR